MTEEFNQQIHKQFADQIIVKAISCFTQIGVADNERAIGQHLTIDLEVFLDLAKAGQSDELKDTISYIELVKVVEAVCSSKAFSLLEHLAAEICKKVFSEYSAASALGVRVHKPHIPSPAFKGSASVYVFRQR